VSHYRRLPIAGARTGARPPPAPGLSGDPARPPLVLGGESYLLYYLLELRYIGALPHTVCLYTPATGRDHYCPGITVARESNPLRFEVSRMSTEYERESAKVRGPERG